jgi:ABC-2 type transport system permease protein
MTSTLPAPSFGGIIRSEWIKLRSLRSTFWCYLIMVLITIGLGLLLASTFSSPDELPAEQQQGIWVQVATLGIGFSQLVVAVLGALVITGEFGTGMIRSTFAAVPTRVPALLAKALVVGVSTFLVGLVSIVATALLTAPLLPGVGIHPDLGDPAAWLSFIGGAGYLALIALLAFSIGTILRNSAGGIATVLGLILVVPTVFQILAGVTQATWPRNVGTFLPSDAGARMYAYPDDLPAPLDVLVLEPWQGMLVLLAWVVALFSVASVIVRRRDA